MTFWPGTAVPALAVVVMVMAGVSTGTVTGRAPLMVPGGQVEPSAAEVTVLMTSLSPVSGLFTVTV